MRRGIVKKLHYQRMAIERLLHDTALDAASAPVNEPYFSQTGGVGFLEVLLHDRGDVARRERVQVERVFDGDPERVSILHRDQAVAGFSNRTVTSVLIPPRTEKSPTTVIRRG